MRDATDGDYRTTPAQATFYHLLPVFNVYWLYAWPTNFATFVNDRRVVRPINGMVCGIALIASALLSRFFDPAIGTAGYFFVLIYLTRRLKQFVDYMDLQKTASETIETA